MNRQHDRQTPAHTGGSALHPEPPAERKDEPRIARRARRPRLKRSGCCQSRRRRLRGSGVWDDG